MTPERSPIKTNDPREIKKLREKEERTRLRKQNNLKVVMSTKDGREFMWDLLGQCGLYVPSAHQSGSWTYYNEGRRSVGLELVKSISAESYIQMMNENKGENNG